LRPVLPPPSQPFSRDLDFGDALILGERVGGPEAVTAAADDHDLVRRLGIGVAPGALTAPRIRLASA
jgi:hypothetical protein